MLVPAIPPEAGMRLLWSSTPNVCAFATPPQSVAFVSIFLFNVGCFYRPFAALTGRRTGDQSLL